MNQGPSPSRWSLTALFTILLAFRAFAELPPGWQSMDLGVPSQEGGASHVNGTWTISGGGVGVCPAGQFHFVYTEDAEANGIVAYVESVTGGVFYSQAGIMVREDLTVGSAQAMLFTTATNGVMFQWRGTTSSGCLSYSVGGVSAPVWLKLVRMGGSFAGYFSKDAVSWTRLGEPQPIAISKRALVGLAASANDNALLTTAVIKNVALAEPVFGFRSEVWHGLSTAGGLNLEALTNRAMNPSWPDAPSTNFVSQSAHFAGNTAGPSGQRIRWMIIPPVSGNYRFSISSSGPSELRLSTDESPEQATTLAWVGVGVAPGEWLRETNQQSAYVALQAGRRYFMEAISVHNPGATHLSIRGELPNLVVDSPLSTETLTGTRFIPFSGIHQQPGIYEQPQPVTVLDGGTAVFSLLATNQGSLSYQWQISGTNVASGGNNSALMLENLNAALMNGLQISAIVSNAAGAVTSAPALLTVLADSEPPVALRAIYTGTNSARIMFSEPVVVGPATNGPPFVFTNDVQVLSFVTSPEGTSIDLQTAGMAEGVMQEVRLANIFDRSFSRNPLPTNTVVRFFSAPYAPLNIGNATPDGAIYMREGGYSLSGGGKDIGLATDEFQFAYSYREGDFDVSVRVDALSQTDAFAKAGLMAREDLGQSSRYAAVFCTPTIGGVFFSARFLPGARATSMGNVPANIPYTWVRLKRVGAQFTGYTSYDGAVWQLLGTASLSVGSGMYFGMAVTSRDPSNQATAEFRELQNVSGSTEGMLRLAREPLGPSSRTTGLVISELMYHPARDANNRDLEFVEIFNSQPFFQELSGYSLAGDISFTFPQGTILPAGAYIVIAASPTDVAQRYGIANVTGPYTNRLPNSGGTVELRDKFGALLLEARYSAEFPRAIAAAGGGHSLVLAAPSYGERSPKAWAPSDLIGGSPGKTDGRGPELLRALRINEILARTSPPARDFVELFNSGPAPLDISGCFITDDPDMRKFRVPAGTVLAPEAFAVWYQDELGFGLNSEGERVFLIDPSGTRVLDAVSYSAQRAGQPAGRFPDGMQEFVALTQSTSQAPNSAPFQHEIVINEILYNPVSGEDDDEFIELYNRGTNTVDLSQWRLRYGVTFNFPPGTLIAPGGYVVVARNSAKILQNNPSLNPAVVTGDYQGSLSNSGDRIDLLEPDLSISTNNTGRVVTNVVYVLADRAEYQTGGRWGQWSDGGGSSLELSNPDADNNLAPNWAESDESTKAPWTPIEVTGVLDFGSGNYPATQLHAVLLGVGECLLDDIEVFRPGQANVLPNGTFNSGTSGWVFQGTHRLSGLSSGAGIGGSSALRLRATGRGDTGANKTRAALTSQLNAGETVTIRAKARWLKGTPDLLLRLRGNWLEAAARLQTPANAGTPGARNSRFTTTVGPAITDVMHSPAVPAATEPAVVTARVSAPDGVSAVTLVWRNDTSGAAASAIAMNDLGVAGDARMGDGVFTAVLPAPNTRALLAYYIEARDKSIGQAIARFPAAAPTRECLVEFGDPAVTSLLGTYRIWVTKTNVNWWSSREKNSNEPLDATFVYNNSRVVYNMQTLYSGSPFHTRNFNSPVGNPCDYVVSMPDDEPVLGAQDFVLSTTGNLGNDDTQQREQAAFWILRELGAPSLHRRHVLVYVNGNRRGNVYEDSQQPNSDVITEYWPDDSDGQLFKIEDWFEFDDSGSSFNNVDATLGNFTTTGGRKKTARYRWNWRPRAVNGTAHDFTNLFNLVDILRAPRPEPFTQLVTNSVDIEEWMRVLALERMVGNWDSYGYQRGKNMYAYKPANGRWALIPWDIDFVFDLGNGPTSELFSTHDGAMYTLWWNPPFARAYWRAFYDAVNGPLLPERIGRMVDAKHAGLIASGVSAASPNGIKNYAAARRASLINQLATVAAPFNVAAPTLSGNTALLTGTAPVGIHTLLFNGVEYPVTWTSVTAWTAAIPLKAGANTIQITGIDSYGQAFPGASRSVSATYNGPSPTANPAVTINEIQWNSAAPGGAFVELFNNSANITYDLSGWELNGLGFTFQSGALLRPRSYVILAKDAQAFADVHGLGTPVYNVFDGSLQTNGETLTLTTGGTNATVLSKVRYETELPWPANTAPAQSLQLIDADLENWRAGNWQVASTNAPGAQPSWVFVSTTGVASSSSLYMYLESPGEIYLDDVQLVAGTTPGVGLNLVRNGGFESALGGEWVSGSIFGQSTRSTEAMRSGIASLRMVSTGRGSTRASSISQEISPALTTAATYTLSFWYLQSTNGGPLVFRLSGNGITTGQINPAPPGATTNPDPATPGRLNSIARDLPVFPTIVLNEAQPRNLTGITNDMGQRSSWIEVYNYGSNNVSLDGLFLTTNYASLALWSFPTGMSIAPKSFKLVFADAKSSLSSSNEAHASFTLGAQSGVVALSRRDDRGGMQVLDYISYTNIAADRSYGSIPDGQPFSRREMTFATPGATNNASSPAITVAINEWMAENSSAFQDPVDSDREDWFELYNYGDSLADLGGYYLSDDLADKMQFQIPDNGHYVIPPGGFLVVWADDEEFQNTSNRTDLHVNFKLAKEGENLGLYGADAKAVDMVTFGQQATDASQGRYPDGDVTQILGFATPGTNNMPPNQSPVLVPVLDRVIFAGQTLQIKMTGSDPDGLAASLMYRIASGAPPEAGIHALTGLFRWTPTTPTNAQFTIVLSDSGRPSLSATQSFAVTVLPLPRVEVQSSPTGLLTLTMQTIDGKSYQLETTADIISNMWQPAGPLIAGDGSPLSIEIEPAAERQRFYRIAIH